MFYVCRLGLWSARWHARTNLTPSMHSGTVYISDSEPDKSGSLPESSRTNPLRTILSLNNHIKYELKNFSADFRSQLSVFVSILLLFSLNDSITFNKAKTFILYKCYFPRRNFQFNPNVKINIKCFV